MKLLKKQGELHDGLFKCLVLGTADGEDSFRRTRTHMCVGNTHCTGAPLQEVGLCVTEPGPMTPSTHDLLSLHKLIIRTYLCISLCPTSIACASRRKEDLSCN